MHFLYVGFSRPTPEHMGLKSWVIMKFDGAEYSHAYLMYPDVTGATNVLHAIGSGVTIEKFEDFRKARIPVKVFRIAIDADILQQVRGFAMGVVGKDYSQSQLLWILVLRFFRLGWLFRPNTNRKMICSELVCLAMNYFFGVIPPKPYDLMTPKDACELMNRMVLSGKATEIA